MLHSLKLRLANINQKLQELEVLMLILCNIFHKMRFKYSNNRCNNSSLWIKSTCSKQWFVQIASARSSTQPWWTVPKAYHQSSRSSWIDCKLGWWDNSINNNSWPCFRTKYSNSNISTIKVRSDSRICNNSTLGCSLRSIKIRLLLRISCNCSRPQPKDRTQLKLVRLAVNSTLISNSSNWINKLIWCKTWSVGSKICKTELQPAKYQTSLSQLPPTLIIITTNKAWTNSITTWERPKKSSSKKKKKFAASESKWRILTSASSKDTRAFCSRKATIKSWSSCKRQFIIQSKSKRLLICANLMNYQRMKE